MTQNKVYNSTILMWAAFSFLLSISQNLQAELIDDIDDVPAMPLSKPPALDREKVGRPPVQVAPARIAPNTPLQDEPESKSKNRTKIKTSKAGTVKFWSKSLSGLRSPGSLMLEEDVVVTQDDIRLEADKATIYFEPKSRDVQEVHAVGSVRFSRIDPDTGQPIKAEGREAIFSNSKRLITMKGDPVLHRGEDVVRGKVIYYDLKNGWVKADRVEGVVQPATKKVRPSK
jgi:lipopolysaccharide transport protein LptA